MRIGCDVATNWDVTVPSGEKLGVVYAANNVVTRAFLHRRWWLNDPDCVLMRETETDLTDNERMFWLTAAIAAGGALFLSDNLAELTPSQLDVVRKVVPVHSSVVSVPLLLESERVHVMVAHVSESSCIAAILNMSDGEETVFVTAESLGFPSSETGHLAAEFWSNGIRSLPSEYSITPHSALLLAVQEKGTRPHIVFASVNLLYSFPEWTRMEFEEELGRIRIDIPQSVCTTDREEEYLLYIPKRDPSRVEWEGISLPFEIRGRILAFKSPGGCIHVWV